MARVIRTDGAAPASRPSSASRNDINLDAIAQLNKTTNDFIRLELVGDRTIIHLQSSSMRRWLLNDLKDAQNMSVAGIVTDGHNTFFRGAWTLIASVVYSTQLHRWLPVAYTITSRQDTESYRAHFANLLDTMVNLHLSTDEILARIPAVLDYSVAQINGFDEAFVAWFVKTKAHAIPASMLTADLRGAWTAEGKSLAAELRKGCKRHYEASCLRVTNQSRVVAPEKRDEFIRLTKDVIAAKSQEELVSLRVVILQLFPLAKDWLDWWSQVTASSMIGAN
jgi:hypothetical protein